MKNLNEQSDRIKQLFTEERLHGNLVESEEVILNEQEMSNGVSAEPGKRRGKELKAFEKMQKKVMKKYGKSKSEADMAAAFDFRRSEGEKIIEKFTQKPRNFNTKKAVWEDKSKGLKLYSHKDKTGSLTRSKMIALPKGIAASDKVFTSLVEPFALKYFKKKLGEDVMIFWEWKSGKFKGGRRQYMVVFGLQGWSNIEDTPDGEQPAAVAPTDGEQPAAVAPTDGEQPAAVAPTAAAPTDTKTKTQPTAAPTQKGDFTAALTQIGGSQKGFTYVSSGDGKAQKLKDGKVVANYVRESKINKMSLFESAYNFDINKAIVENWKWVEGDKPLSDKLSGNFDKAIGQISDTPVDNSKKSNVPDADGDGIPDSIDRDSGDTTQDKVDSITNVDYSQPIPATPEETPAKTNKIDGVVEILHKAMAGAATNEENIWNALDGLSKPELDAVEKSFNVKYDKLEEWFIDDLSGAELEKANNYFGYGKSGSTPTTQTKPEDDLHGNKNKKPGPNEF